MPKARLLLVDENDDFLDGLSAWLSDHPRLTLAGLAHSGQQAVERAFSLAPDLVLMDLRLPDFSGLEATRLIKLRPDPPLVVLMTFHDSEAIRAKAEAAGADRCLSKHGITADLPLVVESLVRLRSLGTSGIEK